MPTLPLAGQFLTLEGIDGCGKTTQAQLLVQRLQGVAPVLHTRQPGGTTIGQQLRQVLLHPDHTHLHPQAELLLYLADRVQHLHEVILPAVAQGQVVVCDRYHDATVAYQHHARGLDLSPLEPWLKEMVHPHAPVLTFWLDLPVEEAARRMALRAGNPNESRLDAEHQSFHQKVAAGYGAIAQANPQRVVRINAHQTPEAMAADIWQVMQERFDGLS